MSERHFIPAQPGLWLAEVYDNGDFVETPLIGWELRFGLSPTPIGALGQADECYAIKYPDGTYWIPGEGRTRSREDVYEKLKEWEAQIKRRRADVS
jgi:hypothetical protein